MRDFRSIRKFEADWKEANRKIDEAKAKMGQSGGQMPGGGFNLEELVDELAENS